MGVGSDYNTFLGYRAGYGVTTGARNILIGPSTLTASYNQVTSGTGNIAIGNDIEIASSTLNNQLNIGNFIYGTGLSGTGSTVSNAFVGIGTTTPIFPFDVNGILGSVSNSNNASIYLTTGSGYGIIQGTDAVNAAMKNIALQPSGGNVGIGTPTAAHALDVVGDCIAWMGTCINTSAPANAVSYVGASYRFSANANFTIASATRRLGAANTALASTDISRVVVTRAGTLQNLYIKASGNTFSGTVTFTVQKNGGDTALTAQLSGSGVTSASDTTDSVSVSAGDTLALKMVTGAGAGTITVPLAASFEESVTTNVFSSQWVTNGSAISYTGGSVGIGTTTPWANLSIAGNAGGTTPLFTISTSTASATSTALIIDKNGLVGIGTSSPTPALQVNGVVAPNADNTSSLGNSTYRWSAVYAANGVIQTSDQRLKSNVTDLNYGLSDVLKLRPVSFTWTTQPQQGTQLGFIAQEVQPIFPETVNVGDDANHTFGLTYTEFVPIIVRAIQQLDNKLTDLANTLAGFADSFTTKELTFTRAAGDEIDVHRVIADELCAKKSDGTNVCVTGDQLAAALGGTNAGGGTSDTTPTPDTTPPVITINGDNPAHINVGDRYADLGAIVTDNADHNLGLKYFLNGALVSNIVIDTSAAATDTIDYVATDNAGNVATSSRTVVVEAASIALEPPPSPLEPVPPQGELDFLITPKPEQKSPEEINP